MSPRTLKIVLAVSVALNVFAAAAGTAAFVIHKSEARAEMSSRAGRNVGLRDLVAGLDPAVRDQVRKTLRASALAARPDFEQARAARRQAVTLSTAATMDPATVDALLDRSRAAEMRGRQRLEHDTVALLATLKPADRAALAVMLNRQGRGNRGGPRSDSPRSDGLRPEGPPPAARPVS